MVQIRDGDLEHPRKLVEKLTKKISAYGELLSSERMNETEAIITDKH